MNYKFAKLISEVGASEEFKLKVNESYRPIAEKLVEKFKELKTVKVNSILFLDNTETRKTSKGKLVFAEIGKIPGKWQEILMQTTGFYFNFTLTIYKENIEHMSRAQIIALIYHELRHIQEDELIGHDIEDWHEMHDKLGYDWDTTMADIPNLLSNTFDWSKIESPPKLFKATGEPNSEVVLRVVE